MHSNSIKTGQEYDTRIRDTQGCNSKLWLLQEVDLRLFAS